ncbi:MAG: PAS domain S-box protein [Candidatus Dadabacteria bacterium]|nr:PAS domain S-box protein [Candidatus Dadabacteria bacterium]
MIENKIINSLNLGYIRYPKNGKKPLFNSILTRLLGYKNKNAIISSGILEKIYDYIISNIDFSEDNAKSLVLDSTLVRNNGDLIHVKYHIFGTKGILELYVVDTTEHELLKRSLKESEDKTDSILKNLVDGIITMNTSEIIQSVNPAVEKMFEYSSEELIGKNIKILMPEPDKSLHKKYLQNYSRTQKAKIIGIGREVSGRKKDGTIFPIYLGVSEIELSDQKIFIGIIHDITAQKNAQDRLLQTLEEVEERIAERTGELANKNFQLSQEIAERKRTEYILDREAYMVRQNPGPVFRADYSGVLLFANPAAKKLFGKNVVGKNLISVLKGITIEI